MNKNLSITDRELWMRTNEILHYVWDPIGVSGVPQARDEYDSYVPQVFSLLKQNATSAVIADHLTSIARDQMGLSISDASIKHATETADVLVDYKEWIAEKSEQSTPPNPHSPSAQGSFGR